MTLQKNFDKFLSDIEPADTTVSKISRFHTTLREYLKEHNTFGEHVIEMFLSGSYARHTMIRPVLNDGKRDVDVDIITNYSMFDSPTKVLDVGVRTFSWTTRPYSPGPFCTRSDSASPMSA